MPGRTEEEKILQAPIIVTFGGKDYEVKPLVIKESRAWRQKVWEIMVELPKTTKVSSAEPDKFEAALKSMLVSMPDQIVDLFFDYARDLPREEIEEIATDIEMAKAWQQVAEVAFPLLPGLVRTMRGVVPPRVSTPEKKGKKKKPQ